VSIRTFSGTHDWHSSVLSDTDADRAGPDRIVAAIESGRCPRCEGLLPQQFPAGSRLTRCRSIPVCSACGSDEADQCVRRDLALSPASSWPLNREDIDRRRRQRDAGSAHATLGAEGRILTEGGVIPVAPARYDTGGWAQYGLTWP